MVKGHDEQYEEAYHFSDDASEEDELHPPTDDATSSADKPRTPSSNKTAQYKHWLFSLIIFTVLVVVVYRLLRPTTPATPATEVTPVATITPTAPTVQTSQQNVAASPAPTVSSAMSASTVPTTPESMTSTKAATPSLASTVASTGDTGLPRVATNGASGAARQATVIPQETIAPSAQAAMTTQSLPAVIPIAASSSQSTASVVQAKMEALSSESQHLINQLQEQYTNKMSEFTAESKFMQEEMHRLNERVATLEAEIHQLVDSIQAASTAQHRYGGSENGGEHKREQHTAARVRIPYNIQAIIPGRAWLLAANGETLTVTEGDMLRGIGRVSRIDPYDGIVDINVGGDKVVSLSYNNGE